MLASLHDSKQFSLRFSDHNVSDQGWSECHSGPHAGSRKQRFALVGTGHGYLSRARISCCCCHSWHLVNWHGVGESQQLSDRTTLQRQLYTNKLSYSRKPSADGVHWTSEFRLPFDSCILMPTLHTCLLPSLKQVWARQNQTRRKTLCSLLGS